MKIALHAVLRMMSPNTKLIGGVTICQPYVQNQIFSDGEIDVSSDVLFLNKQNF